MTHLRHPHCTELMRWMITILLEDGNAHNDGWTGWDYSWHCQGVVAFFCLGLVDLSVCYYCFCIRGSTLSLSSSLLSSLLTISSTAVFLMLPARLVVVRPCPVVLLNTPTSSPACILCGDADPPHPLRESLLLAPMDLEHLRAKLDSSLVCSILLVRRHWCMVSLGSSQQQLISTDSLSVNHEWLLLIATPPSQQDLSPASSFAAPPYPPECPHRHPP